MDEDDLLCFQEPLGDGQRADLVICDNAAGVAYHMGVAFFQAKRPVRVQPRVHARETATFLPLA